jgi:hypothetical protein
MKKGREKGKKGCAKKKRKKRVSEPLGYPPAKAEPHKV